MDEQHLNGAAPGEAERGFPTEVIRVRENSNLGGRPSIRSSECEETILRRMREGESLIAICDDPALPCRDTVFTWLAADEERRAANTVPEGEVLFSDKYAIAARLRTLAMGEEILTISDDGRNDTYRDTDGKVCVDYDHIQRSKLRVETRKWLMAKMEPKKYGDRVSEISVNTNVQSNCVVMTEAQIEKLQRRKIEALKR